MKYLLSFSLLFVVNMLFANLLFAKPLIENQCIELMQKQSFYEAADVCRVQAEKGERNAQFSMAVLNYQGNGMMSNMGQAQKWMRKAAIQNHNQAQYNLAIMIANGQGTEVDLVEAYAWFKISAENGYSLANDSIKQLGSELSSSEKKQSIQKIADIKKELKN